MIEHVGGGRLATPASLNLVGFGQMLPSQQALVTELRERGTTVLQRTLEADRDAIAWFAAAIAPTEAEERLLAVRWTREFLELRRTKGPGARVALLVPNLSEERDLLESVLREVLAPELQSIDADLSSAPWEFSGGLPLTSSAMVVDALDLIRWILGPLSLDRVSALLLSPYLGTMELNLGLGMWQHALTRAG